MQELKRKLGKDVVRNSSIIRFIENNPITEILSEGSSFLVKGISDRKWIYFSCDDKEEFKKLLTGLDATDTNFASLEDWMIPLIVGELEIDWQLTTLRYFLPVNTEIPENRIKIVQLDKTDAGYIRANSNYKQFLPIEYLEQRIKNSVSAGITENNKLVAWAITHDDGAIGALHVLDDYRNKGYAAEIVIYMSRKIRSAGRTPIAQIEERNASAIKLFKKLRFKHDVVGVEIKA